MRRAMQTLMMVILGVMLLGTTGCNKCHSLCKQLWECTPNSLRKSATKRYGGDKPKWMQACYGKCAKTKDATKTIERFCERTKKLE